MNTWGVIVIAGIGTYFLRGVFVWLHGRWTVPPAVERGLRYVPPAVLAALVAPEVIAPDGSIAIAPPAPELLAATVAALVAWRTRSIAATLAVGLPALWVFQWLL